MKKQEPPRKVAIVKKPAPRPVEKRKAKAPPPPVMVLVHFNADPWSELEVDRRKLGPTPIGNVQLAAGEHRIRATFPDGRVVERSIRLDPKSRRFQIR